MDGTSTGFFVNQEAFGHLPEAKLTRTARDVFDILFSRQIIGQAGKVSIKQEELAKTLKIGQPKVSKAEAELRAKGIVRNRSRGRIEVHPLFGVFENPATMKSAALQALEEGWDLRFHEPADGGQDDGPDGDGGQPLAVVYPMPVLRKAS
ncbi:hypothetical protein [Streptomyces sp. NPDC001948]